MEIVDKSNCPATRSLEMAQFSPLQDKNLLYLQPPASRCAMYNQPYKRPTTKIDLKTTYDVSYLKPDSLKPLRINYGRFQNMAFKKTGNFDFGTTYKLSYDVANGKRAIAYVPKSRLSFTGSHDMTSVHASSYVNPGYVKVSSYKPSQGKLNISIPMESKTTVKESYQNLGPPVAARKQLLQRFWRSKCKMDNQTTNRLSFQKVPISKRMTSLVPFRPVVTTPIEKNTIYNMSYRLPGHFVNNKTV